MRPLFGLVLGAFIGLWAGPIGVVFPIAAFAKGLPYRWGALVGYCIGLAAAMVAYQSLDAFVFQEPEPPQLPLPSVPVAPVDEVRPVALGVDQSVSSDPIVPLWVVAAIPGALIAMLGVAGALWILRNDDEGEISDRH